jgi:hypothetical protein
MSLEKAVVSGLVTMAAGWALQKAYKVTDIYPPAPVFWFAIGLVSTVAMDAAAKRHLLR